MDILLIGPGQAGDCKFPDVNIKPRFNTEFTSSGEKYTSIEL